MIVISGVGTTVPVASGVSGGSVSCTLAAAVAVPSLSASAVANPEGGMNVGVAVNFPVQPARISRMNKRYMRFFSLASLCLSRTWGYVFQSLL